MNSPVPSEQEPENREVETWLRRKFKALHWRVHATFPNVIKNPHLDERDYLKQRAVEKNQITRVPESEEVRNRAVWGVELFGPAEIESLYRQIRKLKWHEPQDHRLGKNVIETIKEWRTYGITGNFNIGVVCDGKHPHFHRSYVGPVPKNVDYLLVNVVQFTPEITCLVVGFVLKEPATTAYENFLNRDYRFEYRVNLGKFSYSVWGPELLKREAIEAERALAGGMVRSWFACNFRGFFYSFSRGTRLPTVELITCNSIPILAHHDEVSENNRWSELLVSQGWGDIFTNTEYPGFRLRRAESSDTFPFHSFASLQISELPIDEFKIYGGITPSSIAYFVHERIDDFICQNAVLHLLHEISRLLKYGRENLETGSRRYKKILKLINEIQVFFDRSVGFPAILSGIQSKANNEWSYKWNKNEFFNKPWTDELALITLSETIRLNTVGLSQRVINDDVATREHLEQLVSILSTREGVKTQRRMERLTYLTALVAISSLIVSLSPNSWVEGVKSYLSTRFKNE